MRNPDECVFLPVPCLRGVDSHIGKRGYVIQNNGRIPAVDDDGISAESLRAPEKAVVRLCRDPRIPGGNNQFFSVRMRLNAVPRVPERRRFAAAVMLGKVMLPVIFPAELNFCGVSAERFLLPAGGRVRPGIQQTGTDLFAHSELQRNGAAAIAEFFHTVIPHSAEIAP